jgi:hypothetical protein
MSDESVTERMGKFGVTERRGVVKGVQSFTEAHVSGSSSGGGGYVYSGSGHFSAPNVNISSYAVTTQRVFVEDERGGEWHLEADKDFPIRSGNRVSAKFVTTKRGGTTAAFARNLDTGQGWKWSVAEHLPSYRWIWLAVIGLWIFLIWRMGNIWAHPNNYEQYLGSYYYADTKDAFFFGNGAILIGFIIQSIRRFALRNRIRQALGT